MLACQRVLLTLLLFHLVEFNVIASISSARGVPYVEIKLFGSTVHEGFFCAPLMFLVGNILNLDDSHLGCTERMNNAFRIAILVAPTDYKEMLEEVLETIRRGILVKDLDVVSIKSGVEYVNTYKVMRATYGDLDYASIENVVHTSILDLSRDENVWLVGHTDFADFFGVTVLQTPVIRRIDPRVPGMWNIGKHLMKIGLQNTTLDSADIYEYSTLPKENRYRLYTEMMCLNDSSWKLMIATKIKLIIQSTETEENLRGWIVYKAADVLKEIFKSDAAFDITIDIHGNEVFVTLFTEVNYPFAITKILVKLLTEYYTTDSSRNDFYINNYEYFGRTLKYMITCNAGAAERFLEEYYARAPATG